MANSGKVIVIGLDGATFDLISPWVEEGKLPTFARLLSGGAHGELRSVIHPYSAQAWSSMVTGKNQGKHRIFDWRERDFSTYGYHFLNASSRVGKAIWSILSDADRQVIVVNVPLSYPPDPVNGVMISGRDTPSNTISGFTYPPGLQAELEDHLPQYRVITEDFRFMRNGHPERAREELLDEIDWRFSAVEYLMNTRPWDFIMLVSTSTDGASHFFWKYFDPGHLLYDPEKGKTYGNTLLEVYQKADERIGRLLEDIDENIHAIVVSDHGSASVSDRAIYLNLWLAQEGLLHFHGDGRSKSGKAAFSAGTVRAIRALKSVYNKLIPSWRIQAGLTRLFSGLRKRFETEVFFADVDWSRTRAYSEEIRGSIWINLKGRDPAGIVEPGAEYESIRDVIIERLSGLQDPETGKPLVRKVWRREDLYEGPFVDRFPDLLIETDDTPMVFRARSYARGREPVQVLEKDELARSPVTGSHVMDGLLILYGNVIKTGKQLPKCSILDVAPTVLYLMGLPVPSDMDGRVIIEGIKPSYVDTHPVEFVDVEQPLFEEMEGEDYTDEETKDIEKRLRGLGYL